MSPWVRLLLAVVAVVAAALLLKVLPPLLVLALFVAGTALATRALKQRSEQDAAAARSTLLGLRPETEDPLALRTLPLTLFARVPEGSIDEPMSGRWRGVDVRSFGYTFTSRLEGGTQVRRALSCAMAPIASAVPAVVVEPQSFVALFPERPDLDRVDVAGRFGARFEVRSVDADLARSFLDDAMMEFLLGTDEAWGFEVRERSALAYGPRTDRADPTPALDALVGFLDRLPEAVRTGPGPGDPAPPPPPDPDDREAV